MNLSDSIDTFILLQRAKHSPATVKLYESNLRQFLASVGNIRTKDVTHHHMVDFFYGPKGVAARSQPVTLNGVRARLLVYVKWARDEGHITQDVMRQVDRAKVFKKERQRLTPDQMLAAIEACRYPRDRIALAIACNTGIRVGSLIDLRVGDVDLAAGTLKYTNFKSKRERLLPITKELDTELRRWLKRYQEDVGPLRPQWYLVPSQWRHGWAKGANGRQQGDFYGFVPDRPIGRPWAIVHRALKEIGLDGDREGFHTFRRSAGRAVFETALHAGDPRALHLAQAFLDHEQASTTQIYIGQSHEREKLDEIMRGKAFLTRGQEARSANVVNLNERRAKRG